MRSMLLEYIKQGFAFVRGERDKFDDEYVEIDKRIKAARNNMNNKRSKDK